MALLGKKPFWRANIYLQKSLGITRDQVFLKLPWGKLFWVLCLCRALPFQWTYCIHICAQGTHSNVLGEGCDLVKGCLIEDDCIHAERVKGIEALHGSAHSQECLACTERSLFACGEAWESKFFYLLLCQVKQAFYMELIRDWRKLGGFFLQFWQSTRRILLVPLVPGPALGSVQVGNAWIACAKLCTRNPKTISLAPECLLFINVYKSFFNGHFNSSVN